MSKCVRMDAKPSAHLIFSTPFPEIRYQRKTDFWEWCRLLYRFSSGFDTVEEKIIFYTDKHRKVTAFASLARAPPSEI